MLNATGCSWALHRLHTLAPTLTFHCDCCLSNLVSDSALVGANFFLFHLFHDQDVSLSFVLQLIFGGVCVAVQLAILKVPLCGCGLGCVTFEFDDATLLGVDGF
jgi:hypothetical protein